jgi:hypothetical protein
MMLEGVADEKGSKSDKEPNLPRQFSPSLTDLPAAQETIYRFLLDIVKRWPPEETLLEFKRLFIYGVESSNPAVMQALQAILQSNHEDEFRHTLKRCCYILVNNWDATRHYQPIRGLVQDLGEATETHYAPTPTLKRLHHWLTRFVNSQDYTDLRLFASRYEAHGQGPWTTRYTSYLLVPQYIDLNNSLEQREAARALSQQLKDQFKFDLSMYIAKSQSQVAIPHKKSPKNPTMLGDEALSLIKTIVAKRGPFSYANLANIFLNQIKDCSYVEFKRSVRSYLVFAIESREFSDLLRLRLREKLQTLYEEHNAHVINDALILRTCNRLIEYLTITHKSEPSTMFGLILSQGNPITLVMSLLKIILICPYSRTFLEARIADLISYYQDYSAEDCAWVVNFLEIFNVTFAIHAENVQFNLIKMDREPKAMGGQNLTDGQAAASTKPFDPKDYRIFSQLKRSTPTHNLFSGIDAETLLDETDSGPGFDVNP